MTLKNNRKRGKFFLFIPPQFHLSEADQQFPKPVAGPAPIIDNKWGVEYHPQ